MLDTLYLARELAPVHAATLLGPGPEKRLEGEITLILRQVERGDPAAREHLLALVMQELRTRARALMDRQAPGHTLQPTALIHEAYLRLFRENQGNFSDRSHFFRVASTAMRCVLVDIARAKGRLKRGAGNRVPLEEHLAAYEANGIDMLALHEALNRLAIQDPRLVSVVELKFFSGLSDKEVAAILGISERTVERDWMTARAWLLRELA